MTEARSLPRETVACQRQDGGVVKLGDATEGVIGLPQKSRQRVLWDNFRAPAKILRSKRFVGKGGAGIRALPRRRRGRRGLPCSDAGGKEKGNSSGNDSLSHDALLNNPSVSLPWQAFRQRDTFSRGGNRARSGDAPNNGASPSSQAANSPPGSLQENACSPPKRRLNCGSNNPSVRLVPRLPPPLTQGRL